MDCEIVILAENIDVCRYFYREVLHIGTPVVDSNNRVVFALDENSSLVLEKSAAKYMEHASSAVRFAFECSSISELESRMVKDGSRLSDGFERLGRTCYRGCDPEGNPFFVWQK